MVIQTPAIDLSAGSFDASAAASLPGAIEAAKDVLIAATTGGAEITSPASIPADSVALLQSLLAEETRPGWKRVHPAGSPLRLWQAKRKLTVDGEFGPSSSSQLFRETGFTALVRYFPKSSPSKAAALKSYAAKINAVAAETKHTDAAAAVLGRELGQGWAANPAPSKDAITWQP